MKLPAVRHGAIGLLTASLFALLIGCGGGGGGGGGSSDGGADGTTGVNSPAIELLDASNYSADLETLQAGQTYQGRVWGRDDTGNIVYPGSTAWSTNAPAGVATATDTGVLSVTSVGAGTYAIRANGGSLSANYQMTSRSAVVRGRLLNDDGQGVPGANIRFYANSGTLLDIAVTGSNGTFRIPLPPSAVSFMVDLAPINTKYYNQFGFGDKDYSMICPANKASLPALSNGTTVTLPVNPVVYRKGDGTTPPPPPPGCGL